MNTVADIRDAGIIPLEGDFENKPGAFNLRYRFNVTLHFTLFDSRVSRSMYVNSLRTISACQTPANLNCHITLLKINISSNSYKTQRHDKIEICKETCAIWKFFRTLFAKESCND